MSIIIWQFVTNYRIAARAVTHTRVKYHRSREPHGRTRERFVPRNNRPPLSKLRHTARPKGDSWFRPITTSELATVSSIGAECSAESSRPVPFVLFSFFLSLLGSRNTRSKSTVKVQMNWWPGVLNLSAPEGKIRDQADLLPSRTVRARNSFEFHRPSHCHFRTGSATQRNEPIHENGPPVNSIERNIQLHHVDSYSWASIVSMRIWWITFGKLGAIFRYYRSLLCEEYHVERRFCCGYNILKI